MRAVFAKHDLLNEFDHWSDVSVWHRVRVVPSLLFYDGGALVSAARQRGGLLLQRQRRPACKAACIERCSHRTLLHLLMLLLLLLLPPPQVRKLTLHDLRRMGEATSSQVTLLSCSWPLQLHSCRTGRRMACC